MTEPLATPGFNPAELQRIAATYPPEVAQTLASERERFFTDIQRAAWDLRFAGHRRAILTEPMEIARG